MRSSEFVLLSVWISSPKQQSAPLSFFTLFLLWSVFSLISISLSVYLTPPSSLSFQAPPSSPPTSNVLSPCWAPLSWHSDGSYHFHQPCLSPCLCDVKYHPFTQLHLIFSRPSLSPSYLPSHFSHHLWQPSLSAEVYTCFLLSPLVFFWSPASLFVSVKRAFQSLSVIGFTSVSVRTQKEWKDGDGLVCAGGAERLEREEQNQKDVLCLESLVPVICRAAG